MRILIFLKIRVVQRSPEGEVVTIIHMQGAFLGGVMGAVTRLDPNTTQNLASQPGASPGTPQFRQTSSQAFPPAASIVGDSLADAQWHHVVSDRLLVLAADMVKQMQAFQQGGPWVQGRNFAVLTGVGAGLSIALKRIRQKDDVYNT